MDVVNTTFDDQLKVLFTSSNVYVLNYIDDTTLNYTPLNNATNLSEELKEVSKNAPFKDIAEGKSSDQMLYIYTSGTTGMPKAAIMTQSR